MKTLILISMLALGLLSCKNPEAIDQKDQLFHQAYIDQSENGIDPKLIEEYDHFWLMKELTRGDFSIEQNSSCADPEMNTISFGGVVYKGAITEEGSLPIQANGELIINNNIVVNADPELHDRYYKGGPASEFEGVFGKELHVQLTGKEYEGFDDSFEVPEELQLKSSCASSSSPLVLSRTESLPLQWNADPKNTKGVIIELIPLPDINDFKPIIGQQLDMTRILVIDDGDYTIDAALLASYKEGTRLMLNLYRGNFKYINAREPSKEKYRFLIFSRNTSHLQLK